MSADAPGKTLEEILTALEDMKYGRVPGDSKHQYQTLKCSLFGGVCTGSLEEVTTALIDETKASMIWPVREPLL